MKNNRRNVMHSVKINRLELLDIVKTNRESHIAEYNEAVEDYKVAILNIATKNLKLAKTAELDKFTELKSFPSKPVSYESNYSKAIRMLELSVEDVIEVEDDVFNQLVLDEWQWKSSFSISASAYKSFL